MHYSQDQRQQKTGTQSLGEQSETKRFEHAQSTEIEAACTKKTGPKPRHFYHLFYRETSRRVTFYTKAHAFSKNPEKLKT